MKPIEHLIVVGGGTAGWMTAAALSHFYCAKGLRVTLIESDQIGTVGVGEATIPHIRYFNQTLGIDEHAFMQATSATYKLGIQFTDWGQLGNRYIHPFGEFGRKIENIDFHHWWLRKQHSGAVDSIFDYSLPAVACRLGRFDFPDPSDPILSSYSYAFHLDAALYAKFLRQYSEAKGVERVEGKITNVNQHPDSGDITAVELDNGRSISGDFFIDCSGFSGLLIEATLKTGFESWKDVLPCDAAVAMPTTAEGDQLPPYTESIAKGAGWQWRIPLQHRTGNGYVYSRAFIDDEPAADALIAEVKGEPLADPKFLRFEAGRRLRSWNKNCVAIGLSSGFLEPLESTSIYLIQAAIMKLIELFPSAGGNQARQNEFNRSLKYEYETVKDFLVLHYHANTRTDSEFWRYCQNMKIPDTLHQKIEIFRQAGFTKDYELGIFMQPSWLAVFLGQGVNPLHAHPLTETRTDQEILRMLDQLKNKISASAAGLRCHQDALNSLLSGTGTRSGGSPASLSLYGRGG